MPDPSERLYVDELRRFQSQELGNGMEEKLSVNAHPVREETSDRTLFRNVAIQRTKHVPGPFRSKTSGAGGPRTIGAAVMCQTLAASERAAVNGVVRKDWWTRRARGMTTNE